VDTRRIPPAGDPFTAKKPETDQRQRLARLEDRHRHEIMDDDERQRLRDEILRLRRREER